MGTCEWIIDSLKEWVLSFAYATEAWVLAKLYLQKAEYPGYGMPIHVTGVCDPDVTCTYFRCGDYLGKPCYSQEDGSYFIWWDGARWLIGTEVGGGPGTRKFRRDDPSVFGDYDARPGSTGTPTVAPGYKYLLTGFVDRGDPADYDFRNVNFTTDGTWYELDLSGIVPAGAKAVAVNFVAAHAMVQKLAMFRRHGNVSFINSSRLYTQVAGSLVSFDIVIPVDADRKIEYNFVAGPWLIADFVIKGWWL